MNTAVQAATLQVEHIKEHIYDGVLYLGYAQPDDTCDGCSFQRGKSCKRPLGDPAFYCTAKNNSSVPIIWVATVGEGL